MRAHFKAHMVGALIASPSVVSPLSQATVNLYEQGTTTPIAETIYSGPTGAGTLSNPITAEAITGIVEFYLAAEKRLDLLVSKTGFAGERVTVDVKKPKAPDSILDYDYLTAAQVADIQARTLSVDVSAAVQAFLNDTPAGGRILLPSGTYRLDSQLYRAGINNILICGDGMGRTILVESAGATIPGGASGTISLSGCPDVEIAHLTVAGQGGVGIAGDLTRKGIYGTACPGLHVHHVEAKNTLGESLYVSGDSPRTWFVDDYVHDGSLVALNINSSASTSESCIVARNYTANMRGAHILTAAKSVLIALNRLIQPTARGSDLLCISAESDLFEIIGNIIRGCDISNAEAYLISVGVANVSGARGLVAHNTVVGNTVAGVGGAMAARNVAGPVKFNGNLVSGNGKAVTGLNAPALRLMGSSLGVVDIDGETYQEVGGIQTEGIHVNAGTSASGVRVGRIDFRCTTPLNLLADIGSGVEFSGTGSPEGVYAAPVSSRYFRKDGGAGTCFYVKESGTGNTGWVAK